ncbi:MAG TPA: hypothetical protein DCE41_20160 [Cytophagales bacterium]|nr:hypothetical protein [Cytophagales bacterium]HAA20098.1 hypothetical protein [Cytophagales bacterium]HAP60042.1 hypothetical protein [Cytophagales bacterium]
MSTQEQVLKQMALLPEAAQHQVLEFVQALLGQQEGKEELPQEALDAIDKGLKQAQNGELTLHAEVRKRYRAGNRVMDQAEYGPKLNEVLAHRVASLEANPHLARPAEEVEAEIKARYGWE